MIFEYQYVKDKQHELNAAGREGWEAVAVIPDLTIHRQVGSVTTCKVLMKRRKDA